MHNPITTAVDARSRNVSPPAAGTGKRSRQPFAPLCTRTVEVVITHVEDEAGRPLVGVFVPDGELL